MDDKELLERAARAAGYEFIYENEIEPRIKSESGGTEYWNPLTDDGAALRLANKLGLIVSVSRPEVKHRSTTARRENEGFGITIMHGQDADRATRYAIVRAAADVARKFMT